MAELNVGKVYIIHYKKAERRREHMLCLLKNYNITNYQFRDFYQKEELTPELREKYFKFKQNTYCGIEKFDNAYISITIEHIETYKDIVENGVDDKWYLIFEDDAQPCGDFVNELNRHLENVPEDAEYLDISNFFQINSPNMWERKDSTRTTISYLIKKETCKKLLTTIIPFEWAIDHELNKQFKIHDMKVYWSSKSLVFVDNHTFGSTLPT